MRTTERHAARMASTVFIPDFRQRFEAAGRPRLPSLERLVARAVQRPVPAETEFLAPLFGLDPDRLASGPFMHLADGGAADDAYRLCADFVHLAPDRDQLVLMPQPLLQALPEELAALTAAFNSLYGAEGWMLELMASGRAYLRSPRPLDVATSGPQAVAGQAVLEYMPQGEDAVLLKQLMNETQMLFHTHAVNRAREDADRPLINSLWFWGGGALPAGGPAARSPAVVGDMPLLRGLALWAGNEPQASIPVRIAGQDLLGSVSMDLDTLERDWFAPLLAGLKSGSVKEVALYLGDMGLFTLGSGAARRFWRRPRPLTRVTG